VNRRLARRSMRSPARLQPPRFDPFFRSDCDSSPSRYHRARFRVGPVSKTPAASANISLNGAGSLGAIQLRQERSPLGKMADQTQQGHIGRTVR